MASMWLKLQYEGLRVDSKSVSFFLMDNLDLNELIATALTALRFQDRILGGILAGTLFRTVKTVPMFTF